MKPPFPYLFLILLQNVASFDHSGNKTDYLALLAIKTQLHHSEGVLRSWNHSVHHCHWEGVTCWHKYNRVTRLDLNSRGLSGNISPFIGNLTFLNTIYLYNNSLYGHIPNSLGNLLRLKNLGLSHNTLTGEIPTNVSSCVNLVYLGLDYNKLEGQLPAALSALLKLKYLGVYSNKLKGPFFHIIQNLTSLQGIEATYNSFTGIIPDNINRMQNLKVLAVASNKLSGTLPSSLFNMSCLTALDLGFNQFNGELPTHMGFNVSRLTWLDFSENNFQGPLPIITNFTNLEYIGFYDNNFTGTITIDFRHFYNLGKLLLSGNHLKGDISVISTLINCTKLSALNLASNQLSGVLPKSIANLSTSLTFFLIGDNSMVSGEFPIGITNLINLEILDMNNMKLTSSIPHDVGKLHELEDLELSSNKLSGKIPDSWSNLSRLSRLNLDHNKLEGSIPQSIGKCQSLLFLDLSNNELNGTLDHHKLFTGLATLVELDLSYNDLGGNLPSEISKQTSLVYLMLSNNMFSGVLPEGLSKCSELQHLMMDLNFFHGVIPSSYASLTGLQVLDLAQNNLSGPFPAFLFRLPVSILDLSFNNFQGRVPKHSVSTSVSLEGNIWLCGGNPELYLPKCIEEEIEERKKGAMFHSLLIPVISALVGALAVVTSIYFACIRRKKTSLPSDSFMGKEFKRVSYDMLFKAANGFSEDNLLGAGSFGYVFKGILDGKTVAVKVLNLQHHAAFKSFMGECKALRNVRHRNLVGIITACSSIDSQGNDFKALIYEFMPNGSLATWLNDGVGNMSLFQRLSIAIDVAHALNYLHHECENPIVHCDLKPSNILLNQDMVAHVGDFGLTRFLTQPRHPNQSSTLGIMGTIGYAAPEYGLGSRVSTEGDVYSYGILLLELMTGKSPTNNMFREDDNLHKYAEAALPDQVLQIVDPTLVENNSTEEADNIREIQGAFQRREECIVSVISVGVLCSKHFPRDRLKLPDAMRMLEAARDNYLGTKQRRRERTARSYNLYPT